MPDYKTLLDSIRDKTSEPPEVVTALDLPGIDEWSRGRVVTTVRPASYLDGPGGLFGGYIAMIADTLAAHVSMTLLDDDEWIVTTDLAVVYRKALKADRIVATSSATRNAEVVTCTIEFRMANVDPTAEAAATASVVERVRSTRSDRRADHTWNDTST